MIIYKAKYEYRHQIEPQNVTVGYYKSKQSAVNAIATKYNMNELQKEILNSNQFYSSSISYYYLSMLELRD